MSKDREIKRAREEKLFRDVISRMIKPKNYKPLTADEQRHNNSLLTGFLSHYKTNNQFVAFLNGMNVTEDEIHLKTFIKEYTMLFKPELSYGKYLRFLNYTDYTLHGIFIVPFTKFFSELPRKYYCKIVNKSIDPNKKRVNAKRKTLKDGTLSKVIPPKKAKRVMQYETSYVDYFTTSNAGNLKNCVLTYFKVNKKLSAKDKPVRLARGTDHKRVTDNKVTFDIHSGKGTEAEIVAQYGILTSYSYKQLAKYNVANMANAHSEKAKAKAKIQKRVNRLAELQAKHEIDFHKIVKYSLGEHNILLNPTAIDEDYDKFMTMCNKVLKKKAYENFDKYIDSTDKFEIAIAETLAKKFHKDVLKALKWK